MHPFSALSGPVPPLHPHPAARVVRGEGGGGGVGRKVGVVGDSCGVGASDGRDIAIECATHSGYHGVIYALDPIGVGVRWRL